MTIKSSDMYFKVFGLAYFMVLSLARLCSAKLYDGWWIKKALEGSCDIIEVIYQNLPGGTKEN